MKTWLITRLVGLVSPKYIGSWARHLTSTISGVLIATAGIKPELVAELAGPLELVIAGVLAFLLSLVLSIGHAEKKERE
jgi:hypothetical protein